MSRIKNNSVTLTRLVLLALIVILPLAGCLSEMTGWSTPPPENFASLANSSSRIDQLVLAKLRQTNMAPSPICSDEVFVRRVYLDVIGTLPWPGEVRNFLSDTRPNKRSLLIDRLLARSEFADYWGLKWGDLLRVKSEFPANLWPNAVQAYDRWIRDSIRSNKPYDQFARELLTANGSDFRDPPANFYRGFQERTPVNIAENVALVFMGLRLQSSGLTNEQIRGFSAFFAKIGYKNTDEWKEEIVYFNPDAKRMDTATNLPPAKPTPLGGAPLDLRSDQDPRIAFANWLTAPDNPWFARAIVNRTWYWLLGRGIVHEPDDMQPANAPWSPELLAYLSSELVSHHYDLKHIYRLILNSKTYQLDSRANKWNQDDTAGFSHYRIRQLDAEPLLDAINQITGGSEKYTSAIPEPYTVLPNDQRAITLADASIDSTFLELFGRPPRNTSFASERSTAPSTLQAQNLLNSSFIQRKIERCQMVQDAAKAKPAPVAAKPVDSSKTNAVKILPPVPATGTNNLERVKLVEDLYIKILSRFPTAGETSIAVAELESPRRKPPEAVADLIWTLLNTKEFILKH